MGYLGETKSDEKPAFEALVMGMQIAKDRGFKNVKAVGNSTDLQNKVLYLFLFLFLFFEGKVLLLFKLNIV